jgi:CheY-like chemotaxis protein
MPEIVIVSDRQVLVVDDDDGARQSIKLLLGLDGHTVTEARDGAEALNRFTAGRFDLVITDYLMPNMLGDELAHAIRSIAPLQPIVMVTGYFENLINGNVMADAVLSKPFGVDELRLAIAKPMQRARAARAPLRTDNPEITGASRQDIKERASATTQLLSGILARRGLSQSPDDLQK